MNIAPKIPESDDARSIAQYVEAMAKDLKGLAASSGLGFLSYLLAMVEAEAGSSARQPRDGKN